MGFVLLWMCSLWVNAQTVKIKPNTGNIITALSYDNERHIPGFGGMWIHNQVALTFTSSDESTLLENGLLKEHANNISATDESLVLASTGHSYMTLAMPNGYRITSYKMVIVNNATNADEIITSGNEMSRSNSFTFSETQSDYTTVIQSVDLGQEASDREISFARTATSADDMGNIIYFDFYGNGSNDLAYIYVKYYEITFETDDPFTVNVMPATAISGGVDCALVSFETGRSDLGILSYNTKNERTFFSYNYGNVKSLTANVGLYNENGIKDGMYEPEQVVNGDIQSNGNYFLLRNNTYYMEVPTTAIGEGGTETPVGYRITGAKVNYKYNDATTTSFCIVDGSGKYMNTSRNFVESRTIWTIDAEGYISSGDTYLCVLKEPKETGNGYYLSLSTTTDKSSILTDYLFKIDGENRIYFTFNTSDIAYINTASGSSLTTNAELSPVLEYKTTFPFTLNLYDKTGSNIVETVAVNAGNTEGTLELTGLNNDAIKFSITDAEGNAALVNVQLLLEVLNPFMVKTDVVATQISGEQRSLSQQFTSDDFAVGGGNVDFFVPTNFISSDQKLKMSFQNLYNAHFDNTYFSGQGTGNARFAYVGSEYYTLINENLQAHRTEAADYDYRKKVNVDVAGNKAFEYNNSSELVADAIHDADYTTYYKENLFALSDYQAAGGALNTIELGNGESTDCYLYISDETRYNLAPTTVPRHMAYAYYHMGITLRTADYDPVFTYKPVYATTMHNNALDTNPYVGVELSAANGGTLLSDGEGYLYAQQVKEKIEADIAAGVENAPVDAAHILYLDGSRLNSIIYGVRDDSPYGKLEMLKGMIAPNALVYLPENTSYGLENFASKSESGDFVATNNIVLADQQPFYAPYDIRVSADNYVQYTRNVTNTNGRVQFVSVVLPFTVAIDENGQHANNDGTSRITFYSMQSPALSNPEGNENEDYQADAHFQPVSGQMQTTANTPYLVGIDSYENSEEGSKVLFVARQYGSDILATPASIDGESATGTLNGTSASFTQHGTFSGIQLPKQDGYFYFSKDRFVSSLNLGSAYSHVYVLPFRTYYDYAGTGSLRMLNISLLPNNGETTGVETAADSRQLAFATATHTLYVRAYADVCVEVHSLSGQRVCTLHLNAGEQRAIDLPAGVYLVNGEKVLVK